MAIVNRDYYVNAFYGDTVALQDFDRFEARAERTIAQITRGRSAEENFADLATWQQDAVKNAICYQIEYYAQYGIDVTVAGRQSAGFSVGQVRVDGSPQIAVGARSMVCPAAISELEQTGLLNPQVGTAGATALYPWGVY